MPAEAASPLARLFQFTVPGLPGVWLGIPVQQVKAVIASPSVLPVPLCAPAILGVSQWSDDIICVVDTARLLSPNPPGATPAVSNLLVVEVAANRHRHITGLAILEGAGMIALPAKMPAAPLPEGISGGALYGVVRADGRDMALLDLNRLLTGVQAH